MYRSRSSTCGVSDTVEQHPLGAVDPAAEHLLQRRRRLVKAPRDQECRQIDRAQPILRLPVLDRTDHMELTRPVHRLVDGRVALDPRERLQYFGRPRVETAEMARIEDLGGRRRTPGDPLSPPPRDAARSPRPRAGDRPEADSPQRRSPGTKRQCRRARAACGPAGSVKAYSCERGEPGPHDWPSTWMTGAYPRPRRRVCTARAPNKLGRSGE